MATAKMYVSKNIWIKAIASKIVTFLRYIPQKHNTNLF